MMTSRTGSNQKKNSNQAVVASCELRVASSRKLTTLNSPLTTPERGLTLIEVLISVVLLAGGVVLVMQSFATASEAMARADDRSAAYLFAKEGAQVAIAGRRAEPLKQVVNHSRRHDPVSGLWMGLVDGSVKSVERTARIFLPEGAATAPELEPGKILRYTF